MKRTLYHEEHELFREQFKKFLEREAVPYYAQWERDGIVSREAWLKAGEAGFLCPWLPERYGGSGADFLYSAVIAEEVAKALVHGFYIYLHNDIVVPYLYTYTDDKQKERWLRKCCTGEYIAAIAMTEPDAGSDLQGIRTTAVRDGEHYVVNGRKTFISNGILNDLCIVACKTDPKAVPAHRGISLIVVEAGTPGYEKCRNLEKIGMHAQDTAELAFNDCRVPVANLLGSEGQGFKMLMAKLQQERLVTTVRATTIMAVALDLTRNYVNERKAFGKTIAAFQNTRFKMAEMYTVAELTQTFVDRLIAAHAAGEKIDTETAMAKWWATENLKRIVDECLQFFGGYGYMEEYPIARLYRDVRFQTIAAGTTEIMKEIIARNVLGA
jgi:acyl-CoA dehydrogenase